MRQLGQTFDVLAMRVGPSCRLPALRWDGPQVSAGARVVPATPRSLEPALCKGSNDGRADIPTRFVIGACWDGASLFLANRSDMVQYVKQSDGFTSLRRGALSPPTPAAAFVAAFTPDRVLLPGYGLVGGVGDNAATLGIEPEFDVQRLYRLSEILLGLVRADPVSIYGELAELVRSLDTAMVKAEQCRRGANIVKSAGCAATLAWNVNFATTKFQAKVGLVVAKKVVTELPSLLWSLVDSGKFFYELNIKRSSPLGPSISIAAKPAPAAPASPPSPKVEVPTSAPSPTPAPGPTTPPPPRPYAGNLRVVVYGGGHVGVAFDVGWQSGRDPVVCHFFRDGVEVFTAQCGTSSSKQFYGVPAGTHTWHATVSDRFGVYSEPTNYVTRYSN